MKQQITSLNELRGLAAVMVVCAHMPCTLQLLGGNPGGYAVTLFYLLSGFLTVMSSEHSTKYFLRKRIIKLLPLYYSMTLVAYVLATIKPEWFHTIQANVPNLIKSLLFIPYTNPNGFVRPVLDVGWYLNLEVFYYIVFWIALKISYKYRIEICSLLLGIVYIIGGIFFARNSIYITYRRGIIALIVGMYLYVVYRTMTEKSLGMSEVKKKPLINVVVYLGFFIGCFGYGAIEKNTNDTMIQIFLPLIVLILFLVMNRWMYTTWIWFISKISLSMYLTHEFVVKGVSRLMYPLDDVNFVTFLVCMLCLAISVGTAWCVWYVIEKKFTDFCWLKFQNKEV
ncbi:MAG: acyltransferase [Oscillospiraceae bacterium]|nr:acyltransferase [Oscillospiraceae bacterium]